jgi:hypothetical protein
MTVHRRWGTVALLAIGAVVVGIGLYHHASGARFVGRVSPMSMSFSDCKKLIAGPPYYVESPRSETLCTGSTKGVWLSASVTNPGHRGAWFQGCHVEAFDSSGRVLFEDDLSLGPLGFLAGPYVGPGQTFRWKWLLTSPQAISRSSTAMRYDAVKCPAIQYKHVPT